MAGALIMAQVNQAKAYWFDQSWAYRKKVTFGTVTADLTDIQIQITNLDTQALYNAGKLKAGCEDLRFTSIHGVLLEYWIEDDGVSCASDTTTDVWVRVPRIEAEGSAIFMYYGNVSAVSVESGSRTFNFFDDFEETTINLSRWEFSGSPAITSGELVLDNSEAVRSIYQTSPNTTFIARVSQSATGLDTARVGLSNSQLSGSFAADDAIAYLLDASTGGNFEVLLANEATTANDNTSLAENTNYNELQLGWRSANVDYLINNSQVGGTGSVTHIANEPLNVRIENTSGSNSLNVDWVAIASYSGSLPSVTTGSEENSPGPLFYLAFDEVSSQQLTNQGSAGTIVSITRGASSSSEGTDPEIISGCVSGNCLHFDGTDDYLNIPDNARLDELTNELSISMWLKPAGTQVQYADILSKHSSPGGIVLEQNSTSLNQYYFGWNDGSNWSCVTSTLFTLQSEIWQHLLLVKSGNTVTAFLDGKQAGTCTGSGSTIAANNQNLMLGRWASNGGRNWKGHMDEVKIYNRALSNQEVLNEYNLNAAELSASTVLNRSGLVGWWKMDEAGWNGTAGEVFDYSYTGNSLTRGGNATTTGGYFGNGGTFDGTNDYIRNTSPTGLPLGASPRTVSLWVKLNTLGTKQALFQYGPPLVTRDTFLIDISSANQPEVTSWADGLTSATTLTTNTWYHLVGTYDGNLTIKLYINGVFNASHTLGGVLNTTLDATGMNIGAWQAGILDDLNGMVDEVRVYNRALDELEIENLYSYKPGPVAHWKFDETSGTTANNEVLGGPQGSLSNMDDSDHVLGKIGNALEFDGTNDFVTAASLPNYAFNLTNKFSFAAWINPALDSTDDVIIGNSWDEAGYQMRITSANRLRMMILTDGSNYRFVDSAVLTSGWHHVVGIWNGTSVVVYVDGTAYSTQNTAGSVTTITPANPLLIGNDISDQAHFFKGKIDDVRIWNYALNISEVNNLANQGATANDTTGPLAHWKMDEASWNGTTGEVKDSSGNGYNGTSGGTAQTTSGIKDRSANFPSTASYTTSSYVNPGANLTLSAWVYARSHRTGQSNLGTPMVGAASTACASAGRNWRPYTLGVFDGVPAYWVTQTANCSTGYTYDFYRTSNHSALTLNEWYHLTVTVQSNTSESRVVTFYVNGQLYTTQQFLNFATTGAFGSTYSTMVGNDNYISSNYAFDGQIDDVRIYDRVLTQTEVSEIFNTSSSNVSIDSDLLPAKVLSLNLDEKSGLTAKNETGNGNATLVNTENSDWIKGKTGNALILDGVNEYAQLADNSVYEGGTTKTISMWVKPSSIGGTHQMLIEKGDTNLSGGSPYFIVICSDGRVGGVAWDANNTTSNSFGSSTVLSAGNWYHIALVIDITQATATNEVAMYINGERQTRTVANCASNTAGNLSTLRSNALPLYVGIRDSSSVKQYPFNGTIDSVRMYSAALTHREIKLDYNGGKPVGYWKFDDAEGNTADDTSGSNSNGTLTNMTLNSAWQTASNCKYNSCLAFDGTSDTVSIANESIYDFERTSQFSACSWTRFNNVSDISHTIVGKLTVGNVGWEFTAYDGSASSDGLLVYLINSFPGNRITNIYDNVLSSGTWYHLCMTYDGSSTNAGVKVYKDGKLLSPSGTINSLSGSILNNQSPYIGGRSNGTLSHNGLIDEVKIWNYELNQSDINREYTSNGGALRFE